MIKAIFFDIDGTLISKQHPRMTKAVKKALGLLREKGILLCIATGRHRLEIEELGILEDFTFDGYITLNGCYCYQQNQVLHKAKIPVVDVQKILEVLAQSKIACMFVEADRMYMNRINDRVKQAQADIHTHIPEVLPVERALTHDIFQIIPYITEEEVPLFLTAAKHCKGTRWHPLAYDIVPVTGGKEAGIKAMLSYFGITREEMIAFGDGHNDIDMLQYAGIGVAMGNGEAITKQHSDYVTTSVEEDGIIAALQHFSIL